MPLTTREQDRQIEALAAEYDHVQIFGGTAEGPVTVGLWMDGQHISDQRVIEPYGLTLGPCRCPECGYDADGRLRIIDWWAEAYPPIPRPARPYAVTDDDCDVDDNGHRHECPKCGEPWEPEAMKPRRPSGNEADLQGAER